MFDCIDIHCHPSLKHYLFDTAISDDTDPPDDDTVLDFPRMKYLYASLPKMNRGHVSMAWVSHYVPEADLVHEAKVLPGLKELLIHLLHGTLAKFEDTADPDAVTRQTLRLIESFTEHAKANGAECPKNLGEMRDARKTNKPVLLHALEGGHHLGRKRLHDGKPDSKAYLDALESFFELGVCSMTLGHFFENDCVSPVNGLPPDVINALHYPKTFTDNGLSKIGEEIVRWMLEQGMIVDLIHCSPKAREAVYAINRERATPRPLVFSHTGVREIFERHAADEHFSDSALNPSDPDLKEIARCDGTIGVILNMYWLRGKDEADLLGGLIKDPGLIYFVETVKHIAKETGSYRHISIGSDHDGFTNVLDDAPDSSFMPTVAQALLDAKIPWSGVEQIMSLNALRVLETGWGK